MAEQQPDRVVGVYRDPDRAGRPERWRVVYWRAGARGALSYGSEGEARAGAERLRGEIAKARALTVGEVLPDWLAEIASGAPVASTLRAIRAKLLLVLPEDTTLISLRRADGDALYVAATQRPTATGQPPAADYHRKALFEARRFCDWLASKEMLTSNPFVKVKPRGKLRRGNDAHPQLRQQEALAWLRAAALRTDPAACAAACCLLLGRRVADLVGNEDGLPGCLIRDLEDGVLHGTAKGGRPWSAHLPTVPEYPDLADRLGALAAGRDPGQPLFAGPHGACLYGRAVRAACAEIAKAADVPRVTPHGLRGTLSTLAAAAEVPEAIAAQVLGHTPQIARQHYTQPIAAEARAQAAGLRGLRSAGVPRNADDSASPTGEK